MFGAIKPNGQVHGPRLAVLFYVQHIIGNDPEPFAWCKLAFKERLVGLAFFNDYLFNGFWGAEQPSEILRPEKVPRNLPHADEAAIAPDNGFQPGSNLKCAGVQAATEDKALIFEERRPNRVHEAR